MEILANVYLYCGLLEKNLGLILSWFAKQIKLIATFTETSESLGN